MNVRIFISMICLVFVLHQTTFAQESNKQQNDLKRPGIGLMASFQGGQYGIALPIIAGSSVAVVPAFSFKYVENASTEIGFGAAMRYYLRMNVNLLPYTGIGAQVIMTDPAETTYMGVKQENESYIDFGANAFLGLEYFLADKFSVGVEAQLNFVKSADDSNRYGNPGGININTASRLCATIYF